jgi:DNA-binding Lrp family transcriptional regulator
MNGLSYFTLFWPFNTFKKNAKYPLSIFSASDIMKPFKWYGGGVSMQLSDLELDLLRILQKDARISSESLGKMLQVTPEEVETALTRLEKDHILVRYSSIVDWSKVEGHEGVTAMIDVKVAPKRGVGFDEVAHRIYRYKEVKSVYLMSGAYDLSVTVEGRSMNEVANFVSEKLSTLDSVLSTTTHFQLKKYKHDGTIFGDVHEDKRIVVSP